MEYTFPFSTCEQTSAVIAQPVSVALNILSIGILLFFLSQSQNLEASILIGLFLLFELVHTWSHIRHVPGNVQVMVIHLLAYALIVGYIQMFYCRFGIVRPALAVLVGGLLVLDVIFFLSRRSVIYYFTTMSLAFFLIFFMYYPMLPRALQSLVVQILVAIVIVIGLILNERYNCRRMMRLKILPYHALVEFVGVFLFYFLSRFVIRLCGTVPRKKGCRL